jgi:sorbitol-specific phosphotransferase system component IIA
MHTSRDKLYVVTVVELVGSDAMSQLEDWLHMQIKFNNELEKHAATLLKRYEVRRRAGL